MKIKLKKIVKSSIEVIINSEISLDIDAKDICLSDCVAYPPLINSHDHLIGNWFPRADGPGRPYINSRLWIDEMKKSFSFLERSKIWYNDGSFDLMKGNSRKIVLLGAYKNLFSGVGLVQDHTPIQSDDYYKMFPIRVLREYTQCHSITMGNWWGGGTAKEEFKKSKGKIPFIIHLGEGIDEAARTEFSKLVEEDLLHSNTMMIHGISLSRLELKKCAEMGATVCWCPISNNFLIGEKLDIDSALEFGVNVVLGTDSSMSGGINLFEELNVAYEKFPGIKPEILFDMVTKNSRRALNLGDDFFALQNGGNSILITKNFRNSPFENLCNIKSEDIVLFLLNGTPLYGDLELLKAFDIDLDNYFLFNIEKEKSKKFVYGHPEKILKEFNEILGYSKKLPYLPFLL